MKEKVKEELKVERKGKKSDKKGTRGERRRERNRVKECSEIQKKAKDKKVLKRRGKKIVLKRNYSYRSNKKSERPANGSAQAIEKRRHKKEGLAILKMKMASDWI